MAPMCTSLYPRKWGITQPPGVPKGRYCANRYVRVGLDLDQASNRFTVHHARKAAASHGAAPRRLCTLEVCVSTLCTRPRRPHDCLEPAAHLSRKSAAQYKGTRATSRAVYRNKQFTTHHMQHNTSPRIYFYAHQTLCTLGVCASIRLRQSNSLHLGELRVNPLLPTELRYNNSAPWESVPKLLFFKL